jgi:hypothetical protein
MGNLLPILGCWSSRTIPDYGDWTLSAGDADRGVRKDRLRQLRVFHRPAGGSIPWIITPLAQISADAWRSLAPSALQRRALPKPSW